MTATDQDHQSGLDESKRAASGVFLDVRSLVKEYPVTKGAVLRRTLDTIKAVSNVSFAVERGETFGLVGESGCGKTTVGRCCVALEKPTSGQILVEGESIASRKRAEAKWQRSQMQMIFQDPYSSLDPRMRVGAIIQEPLRIQRLGSRTSQRARVNELLHEVGLDARARDRYPHEFSGGQRQRIGLARALALNPKLIVADEPVSALDVSIRAQILNLLKRCQQQHHLTYIVISHDLATLKYIADRVGVMYLGKLVEIGPTPQVYSRPVHPYTAGLISSIPVPDPAAERQKSRAMVRGELPSAQRPPTGCRFRTRCPRAAEICAALEPAMAPYGHGHFAACHFPLPARDVNPTVEQASTDPS
jgi:oligopeptide/dipeptide ABC transporter ATP-binding protein